MRRLPQALVYLGIPCIVLLLGQYHADYIGRYDFADSSRFAWSIGFIAALALGAYGLGLPEIPKTWKSRLFAAVVSSVIGVLGVSAVQLFVGDTLLPRFVVFGSGLLLIPWHYAVSALAGAGRSALEQRDRVVIVGPPELETELATELAGDPERPASVVAALTEMNAVESEGDSRPLVDLVHRTRATVLVLSGRAQTDERIIEQAALLHESGVRVRTMSLFYEEWLGKIPVADLGRLSLFFDIGEVHRERFGRFKRLIDLAAAVVGIAALILVVPFVLLGNRIGNRGPLFFLQERVGRGGAVFRIVKFRSMRADDNTSEWTTAGDHRITPFGRQLRRTHVDELPQVWNILKGDLSLVGPRPEQPHYVAELVEKLPYYDLRHIVRPGLTGWAQVKYGYASDERGALEKLQYDFHYLRRQSLAFDLRIAARTVRSVLGGSGSGR